jgi:Protein of unknown function (DUF1569)
MSAHQMVCHLGDCFQVALGEMPVKPAGTLAYRTIVKWIALYAPLRWPPGVDTRPEIDQELGGTKPGEFAADVARVEALVGLMVPGASLDKQRHPIFGRMSTAAWLRWGYLHMDHHLRQFGA